MKSNIHLVLLSLLTNLAFAQTYDDLQKLIELEQTVYFSENAKERAKSIADNVVKAEAYFQKNFEVKPNYILLVLSPTDWKKYVHPSAIYGIPHYLPDGRLIVASENNEFWKRNTPPLDKISNELAQKMENTYSNENGEVELTNFFDLLAIHELGHAFQNTVGMQGQRSWLNELFCNVMLHTFIAEKSSELLPSLTVFPQTNIAAFPADRLKYTKLEDFDLHYNDLAQNNPDNYGWYQCRFHETAGQIYDLGGKAVMTKMWNAFMNQKEKLNDDELAELLKNTHPALEQAINNWNH